MGWPLEHLLALRHRRVAGADEYTKIRHQAPGRQGCVTYFSQRLLEVFCMSLLSAFSGET